MVGFFSQLKDRFSGTFSTEAEEEQEEVGDDYVELAADSTAHKQDKIQIRPFVIDDFEDIRPILDSLRLNNTIALINIRPLKDKDIVELKRAINKIKKTCDAIDGDVAGFGDDWICVTPAFATIYRTPKAEKIE